MERAVFVYTTFPEETLALTIGETLVRDRLAACVNVLPGMRSVFAWKGLVEHGTEVVALIKTRDSLAEEVARAVKARHPYEMPVILFFPAEGGDAATLEWIAAETQPEG